VDKLERLAQLKEAWKNCTRCSLSETRQRLVFGDGNPDAHILVIGEAPGETEDATGRAFQGAAGSKILSRFLRITKLDKDKDLYYTNIVSCRPKVDVVDDRTGMTYRENRVPSKKERESCRERLHSIIYIVDPLIIVALGKTVLQALTGNPTPIAKIRGDIQTLHMAGLQTEIRYPVLPMYCPTFLSRTYNYLPTGPWGETSQDFSNLCQIVDYLRRVYYAIEPPERGERENEESVEDGED